MRSLSIFLLCSLLSIATFAQKHLPDSIAQKAEAFAHFLLYRNHDSTYITSYADNLALKLIASNKFNSFSLMDGSTESTLKYRPDRKLNLGVGMAYKWFALDLVFNVGIGEDSDFENKESFDFQATVFGGKHYISGTYQYYFGYQTGEVDGFPVDAMPADHLRDDIRTAFLSLQYLFAYNYDKFSLKAPFIQNEIQRKSAGSWLFGAKFQLFTMDADSSIIPPTAQMFFSEDANLTNVLSSTFALNAGYMYTYVFKEHFYLTLSAIPGFGIELGDYKTTYKQPIEHRLTTHLMTMNALGYNSRKYFCGVMMTGEITRLRLSDDIALKQIFGKFRFHIGYRFG